MKKPIMCGLDFVRDDKWRPIIRDMRGAEAVGRRIMSDDLRAVGFGVSVFDAGDYFRISFGKNH